MKKAYLFLLFFLGVHLFLLFNLKFTAWPEMVSYPYLLNHNYHLYRDMVYPYTPLLTLVLGGIYKLFGYQLFVLKFFTWFVIFVNDILIFKLVKKLTNKNVYALLSLVFYLFTQPFLEGNQMWFDLAIVPLILIGTCLFINKKYLYSGIFFTFAVLTKQTTGLFLITSSLLLVISKKGFKKLFSFLTGPVILGSVFLVYLLITNSFKWFINWTLIYPSTFWTKFPGYIQMSLSKHKFIILGLLIIPFLLLLFKLKTRFFKDSNLIILTSSILISAVLIYPRFSFFHFQLGIAFSAVFYGIFLSKVKFSYILNSIFYILLFLFISQPVLKTDWQKETRFWGINEVNGSREISDNSKPSDLVYLLGPNSLYYVLSDRLPPKPWVDNFGWYFEIPGVQDNVISSWNTNRPSLIVVEPTQNGNWYDLGTYRPKKLVNWIENEKIKTSILK